MKRLYSKDFVLFFIVSFVTCSLSTPWVLYLYNPPPAYFVKNEQPVKELPRLFPIDKVQPTVEMYFEDAESSMSRITVEATAYCACEKCCGPRPEGQEPRTASGTVPQVNRTIAADTSVFPFGTRMVYDGIVYVVEDVGSAVKNDIIDIYMDSHEEALQWGRRDIEVLVIWN